MWSRKTAKDAVSKLKGQVGGVNLLVGVKFGHGALIADMAFLDDIGAVCDQLGEVQVLFG